MHDNDPKHESKLVKEFLEENNVKVLEQPAQSSDMNSIENIWRIMKLRVAEKSPKSKIELKTAIQQAWDEITPKKFQNLALSFKKSALALYRAGGYFTGY